MYDKYIDLAEHLRYSDHFLSVVAGYTDLHPIVETLASEHTEVRDRISAAITGRQNSGSGLKMSQKDRQSLDSQVISQLESLFYALKSAAGTATFDLTRFFPNGKKSDIGRRVADLKASLQRCIDGLAQYPTIPNAAVWTQTLTELQSQYNPKVNEVSSQDSTKRTATIDLRQLRSDWKRNYLYSKRIMEGLLIRAGRGEEYKGMFLDLQVAAPAAKKTSSDSDAPAETSGSAPAGTSGSAPASNDGASDPTSTGGSSQPTSSSQAA